MPGRVVIATIVFFACLAIGRWAQESGLRHLSSEQKAALLDSLSGIRKYSLIAALPVVLAAFHFSTYGPWLVGAFVAVFVGLTYLRVQALHLPSPFNRAYSTHLGLYLAGTVTFLIVVYLL